MLDDGGRVVLGVDPRSKRLFSDPFRGFDVQDAEEALRAACNGHCDDVLFALNDGRFALVHLSYPGSAPEPATLA